MASPLAFYRLPHHAASGSWNMAADGSLLEWVSRGSSRLVFRTYAWERPTLSLGRSEPYPEGWDVEAIERAGIEVVRRPTGGNAVLHTEEVTFALAASIPGPWGLTPRAFAGAAAEALSRALTACGVPDSRVEDARRPRSGGPAALCFARSAPGEVLAKGYKVAGLASRFGRAGALCHASIPLTARSRSIGSLRASRGVESEALERNARSLGELIGAGRDGLAAAVIESLAQEIAARFGGLWSDVDFDLVGIGAGEVVSACAVGAQVLSRRGGG